MELFRDGQAVIRWDNTITYSTALRSEDQNADLVSDLNSDEGNRSFNKGFVSNRFDLLSEFGISASTWGIELSGAAWYDTVYNTSKDHTSPETHNSPSVPHDRFTWATRKVHGRNIDLLNAYIRPDLDAFELPVSFRLGRHTLLWGESLFFASNGIAAG